MDSNRIAIYYTYFIGCYRSRRNGAGPQGYNYGTDLSAALKPSCKLWQSRVLSENYMRTFLWCSPAKMGQNGIGEMVSD
jgi:hypothetical protein